MKLTIGMATYKDMEGVYWTIQNLRANHDLYDCEILVIDNYGEDKKLKDWIKYWMHGKVRYEVHNNIVGTTYPRQKVFERAEGEYVICIDCHVLLLPHSLDRLWQGDDLIHGPMVYDDMKTYTTHMENKWRDNMWGIWADTVEKLPQEPFEIPMHGLGLFGCRKDAWLGFNPDFKGFGGEEGYIHEKFRKAGRKVMCLPWMRWVHRFGYNGNYPLDLSDRIRNYLLGFEELGLDPKPIYDHFGIQVVRKIKERMNETIQ